MFGLPLYIELVEDSALSTWNHVSNLASFIWNKLLPLQATKNMPRSRRRHHSRSKSRSRSHSHERDREPKRRKVDNYKGSVHNHRRTVSSQSEANENIEHIVNIEVFDIGEGAEGDSVTKDQSVDTTKQDQKSSNENRAPNENNDKNQQKEEETRRMSMDEAAIGSVSSAKDDSAALSKSDDSLSGSEEKAPGADDLLDSSNAHCDSANSPNETGSSNLDVSTLTTTDDERKVEQVMTPSKQLEPNVIRKKLESEKKRLERQKEREERQRKKQEERDEKKRLKELERKDREDQKLKEKEAKDKEREQKRKEKEEREEIKRKEKEEKEELKQQERLKRQQEIEEKNKEKQKVEEKKLKAAAAFSKFFLTKTETKPQGKEEPGLATFMPFQPKSDMRLAPRTRVNLEKESKIVLDTYLESQNDDASYLKDLPLKTIGKSGKTWPHEEDVLIVNSDIIDQKACSRKKAKLLSFHTNNRPAYYGTWRKKSSVIKGRKPWAQDAHLLNYEIDSADEWEDEEEGEDIGGSEDEEKEVDAENDYEVDNEFFVPHGHLSDDEEQDEENVEPELRKAKEKLLKNQFEEERKTLQTKPLKSRAIGCVWYNADGRNVDEAIDNALKPYAYIAYGDSVKVLQRDDPDFQATVASSVKKMSELDKELMPDFLKLVHGNPHSWKVIAVEFLEYLKGKDEFVVTKVMLKKTLKKVAAREKCMQKGPMFRKICWMVSEDVQREYNNVEFVIPNKWNNITKVDSLGK